MDRTLRHGRIKEGHTEPKKIIEKKCSKRRRRFINKTEKVDTMDSMILGICVVVTKN